MKKIGIVGHFGGDQVFFDGQTVKTKNLKTLLEDYGGLQTYCVDTYLVKKHKMRLLLKSILCLFKCKNIVILLSENGMSFYLPFLYWLNKIFRRRIFHDIIGSELVAMVRDNPKLVKYLNALEINWFEYQSGAQVLTDLGVTNMSVLPNCKTLEAVDIDRITPYESSDGSYTFCTFSRVMAEKGITDAIQAVAAINQKRAATVARLDIYGPIEETYREELDALLAEHGDCVAYRGIIASQSSVQTLKQYYALLFPTRWHGEGFPGTILDCYAAALPVLASDWNANKEIIVHNRTGMIYPSEETVDLLGTIEWAVDNKDKIDCMKIACRQEYEKYTPGHIAKIICEALTRG
jgi:glycosyltransferase involved in cell wall biosynthesis